MSHRTARKYMEAISLGAGGPMVTTEVCGLRFSRMAAREWLITELTRDDSGRVHARGINLNYGPGELDREFSWSGTDLRDPRYAMAANCEDRGIDTTGIARLDRAIDQ